MDSPQFFIHLLKDVSVASKVLTVMSKAAIRICVQSSCRYAFNSFGLNTKERHFWVL